MGSSYFVSVIVPTYNEAPSIAAVLERLNSVLTHHFERYEIVLVSDGSTDGTELRATESGLGECLTVIHYPENRGKGFALRRGFEKCHGDIVVFCDGDLDIHPDSIPVLIEILELQEAHVVIASKSHPNSVVVYPRIRKIQSVVFSWIVKIVFNLPVRDTQTGLKVFRRKALDKSLSETTTTGFAFDLELLARISRRHKIVEGPVQIDYQFDSRIRIIEPLRMIRDIVRIKRRIN